MTIDILTLFPEMFAGPFGSSIVKRATEKGLVTIRIHNLRDFATDKYKSVDDHPYGGGAGMLLRVDIVDKAISYIKGQTLGKGKILLTDAGGKKFDQQMAYDLATEENITIICGHYEGFDARIKDNLVDLAVSVGDYVLSGGELPAMTMVDAIVRLIPGALGNDKSLVEESHNDDKLEYPQYTRPEEYRGWKVPEVLLSGDHKKIEQWKKDQQK